MFSLPDDLPGIDSVLCLIPQQIIPLKTAAFVDYLPVFIRNPQKAASPVLQVSSDLLNGTIRQHIIPGRSIERCRLKGKPKNPALIHSLSGLPPDRGLEYIIHKIESADPQSQSQHDHRPEQQLK